MIGHWTYCYVVTMETAVQTGCHGDKNCQLVAMETKIMKTCCHRDRKLYRLVDMLTSAQACCHGDKICHVVAMEAKALQKLPW